MPRLHFPVISYAPFLSRERAGHKSYSVQELTSACFNRDNQMIKCETDSQSAWFHKKYGKNEEFCVNETWAKENKNVYESIRNKKILYNELIYARNNYKGKAEQYISCCLLYRGDVAPTTVHSSIETIKQNKLGYITKTH